MSDNSGGTEPHCKRVAQGYDECPHVTDLRAKLAEAEKARDLWVNTSNKIAEESLRTEAERDAAEASAVKFRGAIVKMLDRLEAKYVSNNYDGSTLAFCAICDNWPHKKTCVIDIGHEMLRIPGESDNASPTGDA